MSADDGAGAVGPLFAAPASSLSTALSVRDNLRAKADAAIEALDEERKALTYGKAIDEALAAFSEAANGYRRSVETLNYQLGVSHPSVSQLSASLNRVLRTCVVFTPARDAGEFIAGERRTMTAVSDDHAAAIMRAVQLRLPSNGDS